MNSFNLSSGSVKLIFQLAYIIQILINFSLAYTLLRSVGRDIYKLISAYFVLQTIEDLWMFRLISRSDEMALSFGKISVVLTIFFQIVIAIYIVLVASREAKIFKRSARKKHGTNR